MPAAAAFTIVLAPESLAYLISLQDIPAIFGDTLRFLVFLSQARLPAARIRAIGRARSTVSHSETRKKSVSFKRRDTRYAGARDERYIVVRELSLDRILSLLGNLREI